ncbi:MAG: TIGR03943 family protein [Anaerolineae bacterium]|nr:TIGR03943 family protein [Thermoflexales bacterium]MDW8408915.1 TIGR03943 family protein [Anaerolineae bacterium]
MSRSQILLRAALLAGLALTLYSKFSNGTLVFYINQRFAWLVFVGVLILVILALTMAYRLLERQGASRNAAWHSHKLSLWAILLLAIPIVLGGVVPARPLGAGAAAAWGIAQVAPVPAGAAGTVDWTAGGPRTILDWLRAFSREADPATFVGQEVDVIGFVYRDPRNAADQFWVARFIISCCAADATAVGLLVHSNRASDFENDRWVRVVGRLSVGEFAGERLPIVLADTIQPTDQPAHPYLYP